MATYINARSIFVNEADGFADIVITLSAATPGGVTVSYSVSYDTAQFNDFTSTSGTLTFGATETSKVLRVVLNNDTASEPNESVYLRLSNPVNGVITNPYTIVTIAANDQGTGVPNASVRDVVVDEKAGTALFTVVLDKPAASQVSVAWNTSGITATAGADFSAGNGLLTFSPGQTTRSFEVALIDDSLAEGDELFAVQLSSPTGLAIAQGSALGRIVANDGTLVSQPVISIESPVVDESIGYADVVVRLSAPSSQQVSVNFSGASISASADSDDANTGLNGTLVFAPGETVRVLRIDLADDTAFEPSQSFSLGWSTPVNGTLGQGYSYITIMANDSTAGTPLVGLRDVRVDEKAGVASFVLWLDKPASDVVRVSYSTSSGTATAGADFQDMQGTVSFLPGETAATITVPIFDDSAAEPAERFSLTLNTPVGATIGQGTAYAFIAASDANAASSPTISIDSAVVDESQGYVDVFIRLSAPSTQQVSVLVRDDYYDSSYLQYAYSKSQTLVFAPGETERSVRYVIYDDTASEPSKFFEVQLSTPTNAALGLAYATVNMAGSDGASGTPLAAISDTFVDEKTGLASFVISLDRPSVDPVSVQWATRNDATAGVGVATAGSDFITSGGSIVFAPGETSRTVWVPVVDDSDVEGLEIFQVLLSSPVGAALTKATATAWIAPNDAAAVSSPVIRVLPAMVNEQDGWVEVAVMLSAPSTQQVGVTLSDSYSYTNVSYTDYGYSSTAVLTFAPGETMKVVRYGLVADTAAEPPESFHVGLASATNGVIGNPYASVTIARNNDATGTPVISVHEVVADEKTGLAQFHIVLDRPSTEVVSFSYGTASLSAEQGVDYVGVAGNLSFTPGQTVLTVVVPLIDDTTAEGEELFSFGLSNLVNTTAGQLLSTGRIVANDAANASQPVINLEHSLADEYKGYVDVVVRLSAPSAQQVTVVWTDDYIGTSYFDHAYNFDGTLVFAPGETAKVLRIVLNDDTEAEPPESFYVTLSNATNSAIGMSRALVTLVASDGASGTPVVLASDAAVDEKAGAITFFFALDRPSTDTVSFAFATQHLSTADGDISLRQGRVAFQPGQMLASVTLTVADDSTAENDEFFTIALSDPIGAQLSQSSVVGRIGASDNTVVSTPVVNVESTIVNEIAGFAEVVVRLSAPSTQQVTVQYLDSYINETWRDYSYSNSGSLIFAPGETLKTVRYAIFDDSTAEPAESFYVRLSTPVNAVIGQPYATVTIAPSDGTGTGSFLRVDDVTVDEKAGSATFVISLSQPSTSVVSVNFSTANGTAVASTTNAAGDYVAVSGTVTFAPDETTRRVTVPLNDDALDEGEEIFFLDLSGASGATIAQARGTARIGLSDGALAATPVISIESVVVNEGSGFAESVIKLNRPSAQQVSVTYNNSSESSSQSADYGSANNGILIFAPGETLKTVRWTIEDDSSEEGAETFSVTLSTPVNATIGNPYGYVTIAASDSSTTGLPSASIANTVVDEKDGTARFVVTLDRPSAELLSYSWATAASGTGSATADADFVPRSGTITFWPGETTRTITVPVIDDSLSEADETFTVVLGAPVGGGIAQGVATARIVANDQALVSQPQVSIESTTVYESQGYADVVVRLSAPTSNQVSVTYRDTYPTDVWRDYTYSNGGTLIFAPGTTVKVIRYGIVEDTIVEPSETFTVTLSAPVNATLGTNPATVTIFDRDGGPTATITDNTPGVATVGTNTTFVIVFSQDVTGLTLDDFNLTNATNPRLTGTGSTYELTVQAAAGVEGFELVTLKLDAAFNAAGIGSLPAAAAQPLDTIVPSISSVSPADDTTQVPVDANIVLQFSQPVTFAAVSATLSGPNGIVQSFNPSNPGSTLTLSADGRTLTINPTANFSSGTAYTLSFPTGVVKDLAGNEVPGLVGYNFSSASNSAPVAADGTVAATEDTVFNGNLPAATDVDGDTVTYSLLTAASNGAVVVNANGSYRYTPNNNYSGPDSFSFGISDGRGGSNSYNMAVTVTGVPDTFNGTAGNDVMQGFVGGDIYNGLAGNDTISSGLGSDTLNGGDGTDWASYAERGPEVRVQADLSAGLVIVGNEADRLNSIEGLIGGAGPDTLTGDGQPLNYFIGGGGADTISGGVEAAAGQPRAIDALLFPGATAVNVNLLAGTAIQGGVTDTLAGIEVVFGSSAADTLRGNDGPAKQRDDTLRGNGGNDTIDGGAGNDTAEYNGPRANYTLTRANTSSSNVTVADNVGGDGTDSTSNVERFLFSDKLVAFGQRAEELARVAFVLWTPDIVGSSTLFSRGLSFYDVGYDFDVMCQVVLQFWPQQGQDFAQILVAGARGTTKTAADVLAIMNNAGGGDTGRAAAVAAMAMDPATTNQLSVMGVLQNGLVADLSVPGFGTLFGPVPGG